MEDGNKRSHSSDAEERNVRPRIGEAVGEGARRAPRQTAKGGWVYKILNPRQEIQDRNVPLRLQAKIQVTSKSAAWRYIAERLLDPFRPPQAHNQIVNASYRYDIGKYIIPDPYTPPFNVWVPMFSPRNVDFFMFINHVSIIVSFFVLECISLLT